MLRFSNTDKWTDEWFSALPSIQKLVFLFCLDRCDNAGFMEINPRINSFLLGLTIDEYNAAINGLIGDAVILSKDHKMIWICNFIYHQKNLPLNPENNSHKQIIVILTKNKDNFEKVGAIEGLISPIGKVKVKVSTDIREDSISTKGGMGEKNIDEREQEFLAQISEFKGQFPSHVLDAFYSYWSERSSGKNPKMKFEGEKTWELKKRLVYWASRENKKR